VQTSVTTTNLRVTALVRFIKPVIGLVKRSLISSKFPVYKIVVSFFSPIEIIEKNAYSASQEALKDLSE